MSRAGAQTGLQLQGHGDMQGFNSPFLANTMVQLSVAALRERCARDARYVTRESWWRQQAPERSQMRHMLVNTQKQNLQEALG